MGVLLLMGRGIDSDAEGILTGEQGPQGNELYSLGMESLSDMY